MTAASNYNCPAAAAADQPPDAIQTPDLLAGCEVFTALYWQYFYAALFTVYQPMYVHKARK